MLNTFPILLSYALFVPLLFRLGLVFLLLRIVVTLRNKDAIREYFVGHRYPFARLIPWKLQIVAALCAAFLLIGLFTQITSLVTFYVLLVLGNVNRELKIFKHLDNSFGFAALVAFSLLFLGAGVFALDLPL